jgi:hypothetical protein
MWQRCGGLVLLLSLQAAWVSGQTPYPGLHTDALADASFCPYVNTSPWRRRLPERPAHRRSGEDAIAQRYITNAGPGRPFWRTQGDQDYAGCNPPHTCGNGSGFAVFVATTADHPVTFICRGEQTNYGCWENDVQVCGGGQAGCSRTWQGYAPTHVFGANNEATDDVNWAIVQPNGDVIEAYHCQIHTTISDNALISTGVGSEGICQNGGLSYIGAMLKSNLGTDKGVNGAINSGPNALAIGLKYAHVGVANPQPNSAIWMNTSCNGSGFVYPASSATLECRNPSDGLRTGAHLQLTLTHAEIDAAIDAGAVPAPWRGILYAAHDYGIYLGDTGAGLDNSQPQFAAGWLEDATQVVLQGQHNPWVDWFHALDSSITASTYRPIVYSNPFLPFASSFIVVEDCYATGECSDSPPPDTDCGGPPPPPDDCPRLSRLECMLAVFAGDPLPCGCRPGGGKKRLPAPTNVRVLRAE